MATGPLMDYDGDFDGAEDDAQRIREAEHQLAADNFRQAHNQGRGPSGHVDAGGLVGAVVICVFLLILVVILLHAGVL